MNLEHWNLELAETRLEFILAIIFLRCQISKHIKNRYSINMTSHDDKNLEYLISPDAFLFVLTLCNMIRIFKTYIDNKKIIFYFFPDF